MKGFHVSAGEAIQGHHGPLVSKIFFLNGMKSCDCLGEESNVEKKKQSYALVESDVKFLYFENIRLFGVALEVWDSMQCAKSITLCSMNFELCPL